MGVCGVYRHSGAVRRVDALCSRYYVIWEVSWIQNRIKTMCDDSLLLCVRFISIIIIFRRIKDLNTFGDWIFSSYHTRLPIEQLPLFSVFYAHLSVTTMHYRRPALLYSGQMSCISGLALSLGRIGILLD